MSEGVQVALIAVLPTILTLWFKFRQDSREYKRSLDADNTANAKLDHITVLTNSTLTAANTEIGQLKTQVEHLLEIIKKEQESRKSERTDE